MPDTSQKPDAPDLGYTQEDWDAVSDNPKLTPAELAALRPAREVPEVYAHLPKRGRPKLADAKVNITLRVDPGLLAAYRATGDGWQVRMQMALEACRPPPSDHPVYRPLPDPAPEQDGLHPGQERKRSA